MPPAPELIVREVFIPDTKILSAVHMHDGGEQFHLMPMRQDGTDGVEVRDGARIIQGQMI
jgi:hypothetical protein